MTTNTFLRAVALAGLLVGAYEASAQTATLQGRRLYLYDGGVAPDLQRIGLSAPDAASLLTTYNLTLPTQNGVANDILYIESVTTAGSGENSQLAFTDGGNLFWKVTGNEHSIIDGTNNLFGTLSGTDQRVRMMTNGNLSLVLGNSSDNYNLSIGGALPATDSKLYITYTPTAPGEANGTFSELLYNQGGTDEVTGLYGYVSSNADNSFGTRGNAVYLGGNSGIGVNLIGVQGVANPDGNNIFSLGGQFAAPFADGGSGYNVGSVSYGTGANVNVGAGVIAGGDLSTFKTLLGTMPGNNYGIIVSNEDNGANSAGAYIRSQYDGVMIDATNLGLRVGTTAAPTVGAIIEGTATGLLVGSSSTPAVGVTVQATTTAFHATGATISFDGDGSSYLGDDNTDQHTVVGQLDVNVNAGETSTTTIGQITDGGAISLLANNNITVDVGATTNNLYLNNIATSVIDNDLLWITAGNEVRRQTASATADEGVQFENGAYRLGASTDGDNPVITNRYVRVNAPGSLNFTHAGGTSLLINNNGDVTVNGTGTANTAIGNSTGTFGLTSNQLNVDASTGDISDASAAVTVNDAQGLVVNSGGAADLTILEQSITRNGALLVTTLTGDLSLTALTANTNITGNGSVNITGTTNDVGITALDDITMNLGDDVIINSAAGDLQFNTLSGSFIVNTTLIGANLTITESTITRAGGLTVSATGGGNDLSLTAADDANLTATDVIINGSTSAVINSTGTGSTTIGNTGALSLNATGTNDLTVTVTSGSSDLVLAGITDVAPAANDDILWITDAGNEVRRTGFSGLANEGIQYENSAFRLGSNAVDVNSIVSSRYVTVGAAGTLTFTTAASGNNMLVLNNNGNVDVNTTGAGVTTIGSSSAGNVDIVSGGTISGTASGTVSLTSNTADVTLSSTAAQVVINAGTNVDINATSDVTIDGVNITDNATTAYTLTAPTTNINTTLAATTTIGNTTNGVVNLAGNGNNGITITGAESVAGDNTVVIDAGATTSNLVLNNILLENPIEDILWINASNQVRRSSFAGTANEGIQFENSAYRMGANAIDVNPIVSNRIATVGAAGTLSFQTATGTNNMLQLNNNGNVAISSVGAGTTSIGSATAGAVTVESVSSITATAGTTLDLNAADIDADATATVTIDAGTTLGLTGATGASLTATTNDLTLSATAAAINATAGTTFNATGASGASVTATTGTANISALAGNVNVTATGAGSDVFLNAGQNVWVNTGAGTDLRIREGSIRRNNDPLLIAAGTSTVTVGNTGGTITLDGVSGTPNITATSLASNGGAVIDPVNDGVVVADNAGLLRRRPFSEIIDANQGLVYNETGTDFDVRLGSLVQGNGAGSNTLSTERFINLNGAGAVTFNRGAGADEMLNIDAATDAITADAATISLTGATSVTGATTINTTGTATTSIGSSATGGNITLGVAAANNLVINGLQTAVPAGTDNFIFLNGTNQAKLTTGASLADEGLMFEAGEFKLGHSTDGTNPITSSRFVRIGGGGTLEFNSSATNALLQLTNTGDVNINAEATGTGTVTVGNNGNTANVVASAINVGTGAYATTINVGTETTQNKTINIGSAGAAGAPTINVSASGDAVNINTSGTGTTTIGSVANGGNVFIAAASGSTVALQATSGVNINTAGTGVTNINNAASTGNVSIGHNSNTTTIAGSTVTINGNTEAGNTTIGNTTAGGTVTLNSNTTIVANANTNVNIQTSGNGDVTIGNAPAQNDLLINSNIRGAQAHVNTVTNNQFAGRATYTNGTALPVYAITIDNARVTANSVVIATLYDQGDAIGGQSAFEITNQGAGQFTITVTGGIGAGESIAIHYIVLNQ